MNDSEEVVSAFTDACPFYAPIPTGPRWAAQRRMPPLPCGTHRDPLLHSVRRRPSSFSMSRREVAAERARLLARGWGLHEIRAVLTPAGRRP